MGMMNRFDLPSRLAILGPGLLGGSIALATRRNLPECHVALWARRQSAVDEIVAGSMAARASTDVAEIVRGADLVVLSVPIGAMRDLAVKIRPHLAPDAVVTDVGSVKGPVVETLTAALGNRFVGSHPMAGSDRSGIGAADANLFEKAVCIVTPTDTTPADSVGRIEVFWKMLGCRVEQMDRWRHDEVVSAISHLPHVMAAALVDLVGSRDAEALDFCGPGFRDTTRVAGGPAEMWTEILRSNHAQVKKYLEAMIEKLKEVVILLDDSDGASMKHFLDEARIWRDSLRLNK
jgi:prephenate dehydrogenase